MAEDLAIEDSKVKFKFEIRDLNYVPPVEEPKKKAKATGTVIAIAATIGAIITISCCTAFFCMFRSSLKNNKNEEES